MGTLAAPSLQNLLTNVRNNLNQPNPLNTFWTDAELSEYINEGIRIYFQEVFQNNEGHFTAVTDLDITANTETIALPSDFFAIRTVYKKVSNGYEALAYRNTVQESYSTQGGTSSNSYMPYYYFRGNSLVLRPTPNFSETAGIRIEYIQLPATLIDGGDVMTAQISPLFKQVIESYAVYRAKQKESNVTGVNVTQIPGEHLAGVIKLFRDSVQTRSKGPTFTTPFNPEGM